MIRALLLCLAAALVLEAQARPKIPEAPKFETRRPRKPTGNLRVHVEDAAGKPLAEANVTLTDLKQSFPTGEGGDVLMAALPLGPHPLVVSKDGFQSRSLEIKVEEGITTVVPVRLEPAK